MLSAIFPHDDATEQDWRVPRLHVAQSHGASTVHTVYGFYSRTARHLSREVVDPRRAPEDRPVTAHDHGPVP